MRILISPRHLHLHVLPVESDLPLDAAIQHFLQGVYRLVEFCLNNAFHLGTFTTQKSRENKLPGLSRKALRFPPYPAVRRKAARIHTAMVSLNCDRAGNETKVTIVT